jgi:peptide/nickel transport system permease protein
MSQRQQNMKWILQRVGQSVLTIFTVISLTFVMIRFIPGGPMDYIRGLLARQGGMDSNSPAFRNAVEKYIVVTPDEPVYIQYIDYLTNVVQGNLGESIWYQQPVSELIADALPWTVFLMGSSLILIFSISMVLGALMAYFEGGVFDVGTSLVGIFLNSVPYYVAALLLIFAFATQRSIFPIGGRVDSSLDPGMNGEFVMSVLYHGALPMISLVITGIGGWAVAMRGNSISEIGEDYVRVAELRGLPSHQIATRYVARNAILPLYTSFMISIGFVFGGSVILETIFSYPGLGFYLFQAVNTRDHALMMGAFLVITVAVIIGLLVADLTYGWIDPRTKQGGAHQ